VKAADGEERERRWAVLVRAAAPEDEEVRHWLEEYASALAAKNVTKLRALGEIDSDGEAAALRQKLDAMVNYGIQLENVRVERSASAAKVTFARAERWREGKNPGFVLDFTPESRTLVRDNCRIVAAK
jgi:hypothetical protein